MFFNKISIHPIQFNSQTEIFCQESVEYHQKGNKVTESFQRTPYKSYLYRKSIGDSLRLSQIFVGLDDKDTLEKPDMSSNEVQIYPWISEAGQRRKTTLTNDTLAIRLIRYSTSMKSYCQKIINRSMHPNPSLEYVFIII